MYPGDVVCTCRPRTNSLYGFRGKTFTLLSALDCKGDFYTLSRWDKAYVAYQISSGFKLNSKYNGNGPWICTRIILFDDIVQYRGSMRLVPEYVARKPSPHFLLLAHSEKLLGILLPKST